MPQPAVASGANFWAVSPIFALLALPPQVLDEQQCAKVTETFKATDDFTSADTCTVCLCAMSPGEELCRLACQGRHTFHSHCIGEWLRTASRCCPVDQQDLSTVCLTA